VRQQDSLDSLSLPPETLSDSEETSGCQNLDFKYGLKAHCSSLNILDSLCAHPDEGPLKAASPKQQWSYGHFQYSPSCRGRASSQTYSNGQLPSPSLIYTSSEGIEDAADRTSFEVFCETIRPTFLHSKHGINLANIRTIACNAHLVTEELMPAKESNSATRASNSSLATPDLTIIVVSYNTKDITLAALKSVFDQTKRTVFELIVVDNASSDGSADAIADMFPTVRLIRATENLGFARANNLAAEQARGRWLLLLNPDTIILNGAIDNIVEFGEDHPTAGIYGGRTVFADGRLNIASCWGRITPWSSFCQAVGLSTVFKGSNLFDLEAMGSFQRDQIRQVDIVVGCFLLIQKTLWDRLDGLDTSYWMYGEEADLCLRARALGFTPMITPHATIVHLVGASSSGRASRTILIAKARTTLIRRHWSSPSVPWGMLMMWLWCANRRIASKVLARLVPKRFAADAEKWQAVWDSRADWLGGYPRPTPGHS